MAGLIAPDASSGLDGAGAAGDLVHLGQDLTSDALSWNTAFDAAEIGFDYLSYAGNPFGALISAGVGWLLEHLPYISDAWDKLTGDAGKIEQTAATWENIAQALAASQQAFGSASAQVEQWSGAAADSYRTCAEGYASMLDGTGTQAEAFALAVRGVGGLVATVKDVVYMIISDFIEFTVIPAILGAIATSWCTFGGSIGVAIAYIEVQADIAGVQITGRIAVGTQEVLVVSERTAKAVAKLLAAEDAVRAFGRRLEDSTKFGTEVLKVLGHDTTDQVKAATG